MNVTASLMGDPPPGRSALEQRYQPARITLPSRPLGGGTPKLTAAIVREIRNSIGPSRVVAAEYGIGHKAVCDIRARRTWKKVL